MIWVLLFKKSAANRMKIVDERYKIMRGDFQWKNKRNEKSFLSNTPKRLADHQKDINLSRKKKKTLFIHNNRFLSAIF